MQFTAEELLSSLVDLPIQEQVATLEGLAHDFEIAEVADVLSLCLMTVTIGLDESCPDDVRRRLDGLAAQVRKFNEERFGGAKARE